MIEERNRVKIDQISDYLLCPTKISKEFLRLEGITKNVFVSGNLIVDVCEKVSRLKFLTNDYVGKDFILLTLHRGENVDDVNIFETVMHKLKEIHQHKILFPIHPRTKKNIKANGLVIPQNVILVNPTGYSDFISLLKQAKLVLTDSGGVQEEALILKKPCITLRNTTERWETILVGGNRLYPLSNNDENFSQVVEEMLKVKVKNQPYGKSVTKKTVNIIKKILMELNTGEIKAKTSILNKIKVLR